MQQSELQAVARKLWREQLSREEWQLIAERMKGDLTVMIFKARWIYNRADQLGFKSHGKKSKVKKSKE